MQQIDVTPQKARVKGNVVPNFNEMETPPNIEDFHVSHQNLTTHKYQGVEKSIIRLTPAGEPLYMTVTCSQTSIEPNGSTVITAKLYYKSGGSNVNLKGQSVYIYDNNNLVKTMVSDDNGEIAYEYTTNVEGNHTIKLSTVYSNGYNAVSKSVEIHVYIQPVLSLEPETVTIGHDEITTLHGKLSKKNGEGIPEKEVVLFEGINRVMGRVVTNNKGEFDYSYLESKNRGTPTVLTCNTPVTLIQNQENTITGYLKTKDGTPISGQKVILYYYNWAYGSCDATTDSNGKYELKYTPTNNGEYPYYIVFPSTVVTTSNEYTTYEPTLLELGTLKPKKSPQCTITTQLNTVNTEETTKITCKITDNDYNFANETVTLQHKTSSSTSWSNLTTLTLNNDGTATYNYSKNTKGTYNLRFQYNGNSEYVANSSNTVTVQVNLHEINLETTLPNNAVNVILDTYPISTLVTDNEGNPVSGETIMYYWDSESNSMGSAVTNSNGIATLNWSSTTSHWNNTNNQNETHTIISKHVAGSKYGAKTVSDSVKTVKRTRNLQLSSRYPTIPLTTSFYISASLSYKESVNNNETILNNDITITYEGLTQQPLLKEMYKFLPLNDNTMNEAYMDNENLDLVIGQNSITFIQYPTYMLTNNPPNEKHRFYLENNNTSSKIYFMRLQDDGTFWDGYSYSISPSTYGTEQIIDVEIKGQTATIRSVNTGKTIVKRTNISSGTDSTSKNYKRYIGFSTTTDNSLRITRYENTKQCLTRYQPESSGVMISDQTRTTSENTECTDTVIEQQRITVGQRDDIIILGTPFDMNKDTYIKINVKSTTKYLRFGYCTVQGNTFTPYYKTINNLISDTTVNRDFVIEIIRLETGKIKLGLDGIYTTLPDDMTGQTVYPYFYSNTTGCIIKEIFARDQGHVHNTGLSGTAGDVTEPYGYGEYEVVATVPGNNKYYESRKTVDVLVSDKALPYIDISDITTKKGTNKTIIAETDGDEEGTYNIYLYKDDTTTLLGSSLTINSYGEVQYTTKFSTITHGRYQYYITYSGDDYYVPYISEYKQLNIYSDFTINNDNHISNTITHNTGTDLQLTGTIKDSFNEDYTGTLACKINNKTTNIPVNNGEYNATIDLTSNVLAPGTYTIELKCSNNYITTTKTITLNITKKNISITGGNTAVKIGGNSPTWSCKVPNDYTGAIQVYLMRENSTGETDYYTGSANTSLISSSAMSNKTNFTETTSGGWTTVKWQGWNTSNNTYKNIRDTCGTYRIMYKLYNDTYNGEVNSFATVTTRQQATISVESIRKFEDENAVFNIRVQDTLGNEYTGQIGVAVNGVDKGTVNITNGVGTYTLSKNDRQYEANTNHVTELTFNYEYTNSGYWTVVNATNTTRSYNIKTDTAGAFINTNSNFTLTMANKFISLNITDLYVRVAEDNMTLLNNVLSILNNNNIRDKFRIHAVINCLYNVGESTWYTTTGSDGLSHIDMTRLNTLHTHINNLLKKDIQGICFDYIRRGTANTFNESEVSSVVTDLATFVKNKTTDKTIMISACVTPEYDNAISVYGQNYQTFEENLDYIIPMLYLYDYSTVNTSTPINSGGYYWQQNVLKNINQISSQNKVFPSIQTYHGDSNTSTSTTLEEYMYQILGMWNSSINKGGAKLYTQRSVVYFRAGLMGVDPPNHSKMISTTDTTYQLEVQPILSSSTISKSSGQIRIVFKNKWGGYSGYSGLGTLKIDGTVYKENGSTYTYDITNVVTLTLDLSSYSTGSHTLTIEMQGSTDRHVKGGTWTFPITLTT